MTGNAVNLVVPILLSPENIPFVDLSCIGLTPDDTMQKLVRARAREPNYYAPRPLLKMVSVRVEY